MIRRLVITEFADNPNYEAELVEHGKRFRSGFGEVAPQKTVERESLRCELTDTEYAAVKRAVLEVK